MQIWTFSHEYGGNIFDGIICPSCPHFREEADVMTSFSHFFDKTGIEIVTKENMDYFLDQAVWKYYTKFDSVIQLQHDSEGDLIFLVVMFGRYMKRKQDDTME